jgi:hypothetical protein
VVFVANLFQRFIGTFSDIRIGKTAKYNFIVLFEFQKLMIGAQFVTFFERVGHPAKNDK